VSLSGSGRTEQYLFIYNTIVTMDNIRTPNLVEDNEPKESATSISREIEEEDDDCDVDYLDDEPIRKPKGKKIRKMRSNFDR
jgi:hypothetical protein